MAKKLIRLLLPDANVVLELHRLGVWSGVLDRCEVLLARTVVGESKYFEAEGSRQVPIALGPEIEAQRIRVVDAMPKALLALTKRFPRTFADKLDAGELESLAFLLEKGRDCLIWSADKIVWRTLGALSRGDQGISVEEILQKIGLTRDLDRPFGKQYREEWTRRASSEGFATQ